MRLLGTLQSEAERRDLLEFANGPLDIARTYTLIEKSDCEILKKWY